MLCFLAALYDLVKLYKDKRDFYEEDYLPNDDILENASEHEVSSSRIKPARV